VTGPQLEAAQPGTSALLRDAIGARAAGLALGDSPKWVDHGERVGVLAASVAIEMGLDADTVDGIVVASALHDIGKAVIARAIVDKPHPLSDAEWTEMRLHPIHGYWLLRNRVATTIASAVLAHHENFDGSGYPYGISGSQIPVEARIISVVDAFDAIVDERPYDPIRPRESALAELRSGSGSQFDPRVVEAFLSVMGRTGP
jgi:HD-GYP domain-containing protein (c-di-GMP phosphodiesterase class II)